MMKAFNDIRLQDFKPLTVEEAGWIDILRSIAPDGVPRPTLQAVQALRLALNADLATPPRNSRRCPG